LCGETVRRMDPTRLGVWGGPGLTPERDKEIRWMLSVPIALGRAAWKPGKEKVGNTVNWAREKDS